MRDLASERPPGNVIGEYADSNCSNVSVGCQQVAQSFNQRLWLVLLDMPDSPERPVFATTPADREWYGIGIASMVRSASCTRDVAPSAVPFCSSSRQPTGAKTRFLANKIAGLRPTREPALRRLPELNQPLP